MSRQKLGTNFKKIQQFFLTVGQNNFGNKIPELILNPEGGNFTTQLTLRYEEVG